MRKINSPLRYIEKFYDSNPILRASGSKQVLFRNLSGEQIYKHFSENEKNMLQEYSEYRLSQFKELLVGIDWEDIITTTINEKKEEYNNPNIIFSKEQLIDYYKEEYKSWIVAEVIFDYGPILQVNYEVPETIYSVERSTPSKTLVRINKDSVRAAGAYTNDMCQKIDSLFLFLYNKASDRNKIHNYKTRGGHGMGR